MIRITQPQVGNQEVQSVLAVLTSGNLVQGAEVAAFEAEFSSLVGGRLCVAVNSGTSALHLALLAAGIGPGDEVVIPSFTFAATANAVRLAGAEPVFADIVPTTFSLDPDSVAAAITGRTAAILPVHLFGHPAEPTLRDIAESQGLALIEDAAQAHGASCHGRPVGTWGVAAAFSFYATKNMTTGEGGMAVLADASMARKVRLLRNQGMERPYENEIVGFNMRLTDLAAALGRVQLRRLWEFTARRQANAATLDAALKNSVETPRVRAGAVHVYHQYTIRVDDRDHVQRELAARGVESRVFYPTPVHRLPAFLRDLELPETTRAARQVLSLPVGPHLSSEDLKAVIAALIDIVSR
jgi:dTDP-4-amino-4,6-dideoxygalactose transaminase